jgi:hypothetical protein
LFRAFLEVFMRYLVAAALAATSLALIVSTPAHAVGSRHPFCLQGDEVPGLSDCSYDSYAQCQATASGRFLTCMANPFFAGANAGYSYQGQPAHRHRHHHHHHHHAH